MKKSLITSSIMGLLLVFLVIGFAWAKPLSSYSIYWQVISAGGGPTINTAGNIEMNGSLGQVVIGSSSSKNVKMISGYWSSSIGEIQKLFLPIIINNDN